jgi:threonylcarbamoyladenosine tRNA methylthiotransferase MtaB
MRRGYRPAEYLELCDRAASRGPMGIGADVIAGFPGETDEDFEATIRVVKAAPVTYLHVFRYSSRPGTAAAALSPAVPAGLARARSERLRRLGEEKARAFRESLVGCVLPALPEPNGARPGPGALTDVYVPVALEGPAPGPGILDVEIVASGDEVLSGRVARAGVR